MDQVLVFRLGNEQYGLEVTQIQEVAEAPSLQYIPRAPEHFLGAINFHGNILPVVDLAAFLGLASGQRDPKVIVIMPPGCGMALAVHQVRGFVPCPRDEVMPVGQDAEDNSCIRATLARDEEIINLLDVETLLEHLKAPID